MPIDPQDATNDADPARARWGLDPLDGARWVFGYGSLMWDPGFPAAERQPALLRGYHRDMCILSLRYRGTPERPGLVLGLRLRGSCRGIAYRVEDADWPEARAYLHQREMVTYAYRPRRVPTTLADGRRVVCHTFVADSGHRQYAGHLPGRAHPPAAPGHRAEGLGAGLSGQHGGPSGRPGHPRRPHARPA